MHDLLVQLGRDHDEWGHISISTGAGGRTAIASSVGADRQSPAMANKGKPDQPNEDAALAHDDGALTLLAVADAHFGIEASHTVIQALASMPIPRSFEELSGMLLDLEPVQPAGLSATTLVVAVVDRERGDGFGISFGDSSLVRVGPEGAMVLNVRRSQFIHLRTHGGLDPHFGHGFRFFVKPGELVVAFTDGVNECNYRSPTTSVGPAHLERIFADHGARARDFADALARLALAGVDGHPGGQDNLAIVVTETGNRA